MADIIRSAKSGSDWTISELMAYNITVTTLPPEQFFCGNHSPPLTGVDPSLIDSSVDDENVSDATFQYLRFLGLVTNAAQESDIDMFSYHTLCMSGFDERDLILTTGRNIPLMICGDNRRVAQTDVCLLDQQSMILLVLQKDKRFFLTQPEQQVIAEAIAAFQYNNQIRYNSGRPTLDVMTIPCITMVGTRPTFYLVPVTEALSIAVVTGRYPEVPTKVVKCVTSLGHNREGMETPEYRRVAFQRFLAFKDLAKEYWQTFIV